MWAQEHYSLKTAFVGRHGTPLPVSFGTIRQLRSAASQFFTWDALMSHPDQSLMDRGQHLTQQAGCRPTDLYSLTLFSSGLAARIGNQPRPSVSLLMQHVMWLDKDLERRYRAATTPAARRELSLTGFTNTALWLGWLRGGEMFSAMWDRLTVVDPADAASVDLPVNCGAVMLALQPETKARCDLVAEVILAYRTAGGF